MIGRGKGGFWEISNLELWRACLLYYGQYIGIWGRLRPYTNELLWPFSEKDASLLSPQFFDFSDNMTAVWVQYVFGPELQMAPSLHAGKRVRKVYLLSGRSWNNLRSCEICKCGMMVMMHALKEQIPLSIREGSWLEILGGKW